SEGEGGYDGGSVVTTEIFRNYIASHPDCGQKKPPEPTEQVLHVRVIRNNADCVLRETTYYRQRIEHDFGSNHNGGQLASAAAAAALEAVTQECNTGTGNGNGQRK